MMVRTSLYESLRILLVFGIWMSVLGAVCYGVLRLLRCRTEHASLRSPGRGPRDAFCAYLIFLLCGTALFMLYRELREALPKEAFAHLQPWHLLFPGLLGVAAVVPALFFLRRRKESWASVAVTRANVWQSLIISAVIIVGVSPLDASWKSLSKLEPHNVIDFLYFVLIGCQEEFLFRGFIQTRLVAWRGAVQGWIVTSVAFAFAHMITAVLGQDMSITEGFVSCAVYLPVGLLYGFVVLRTGNLLSSIPVHVLMDFLNNVK